MPLRGADPSLWFSMPGVVAAYQPVAAPDALSARRNMAMGGDVRYCAQPGVLPAWSPATGHTYDGSTQYLSTGISTSNATWTKLVRFSGAPVTGLAAICGYRDASSTQFLLWSSVFGSAGYENNQQMSASPGLASGVLGVAAQIGYRDGVQDAVGGSPYSIGASSATVYIGCANNAGTASWFASCSVQAFVVCCRTLSADEMWLASQQMKYCNVNPAWNVWAPQRRWFFFTPPPPAVATPVLSTIYINSADIGDTSLFDDVSGAAVSSSYARTGGYSFKLDGADYLQADLTSSATKYTKFGLLVTDTPASDALLCAWQETGTEHVSLYLTDKLTLQMRQGSTIIQTSPTTLELATWYCIEAKIVVHTTTGRFQVRIDGLDDMSAIGINTDDDVGGTINEIRFEAPVDDTYIDDIVVREDQWCGVGGVYVIVPTAAGTVEEWTGAYTDVDDLPPSFTDYITATAESGVDQVFRHGELAGDYDIGIVGVFAKGRLDSAAVDTVFEALARVDTTDHSGDAQDLDTIGVYARVVMTTNPDGSVAWTTHAVNNALQIGART